MAAQVAVREARRADEAGVLALIEHLFAPPGRRPPDYTRERGAAGFRHAVEHPDAAILIALDGEAIVGLVDIDTDRCVS